MNLTRATSFFRRRFSVQKSPGCILYTKEIRQLFWRFAVASSEKISSLFYFIAHRKYLTLLFPNKKVMTARQPHCQVLLLSRIVICICNASHLLCTKLRASRNDSQVISTIKSLNCEAKARIFKRGKAQDRKQKKYDSRLTTTTRSILSTS